MSFFYTAMQKGTLPALILAGLISFHSYPTKAERINVEIATQVARIAISGGKQSTRSTNDVRLVYQPSAPQNPLRTATDAAEYYVFNATSQERFVIISGDDIAHPVLAYSTESWFDPENIPANMQVLLDEYQQTIRQSALAEDKGSPEIQAEWSSYLQGKAVSMEGGVLLETARWSQGSPYNDKCPIMDDNGNHAAAGCVATAGAIAMRYYQYPEMAQGGIASYWDLPVEYPAYDWSLMPLRYGTKYTPEEGEQVASLMWNIGANIGMRYSWSSMSNTRALAHALKDVFGYGKQLAYWSSHDMTWNEWKKMLINELDKKRVVPYGISGHALVCDGYLPGGLFHFNWGWGEGGNSNCYYRLSALDGEPHNHNMITGMDKPVPGEKEGVHVSIYQIAVDGKFPLETNETFDVYVGVMNHSLWNFSGYVGLGVIDGEGKLKHLLADPKSATEYDGYEEGQGHEEGNGQVYIFSGCSFHEDLKEGERVAAICSSDAVHWEVATANQKNDSQGFTQQGYLEPEDNNINNDSDLKWVAIRDDRFSDAYYLVNREYSSDITYTLNGAEGNIQIHYNFGKDWAKYLSVYCLEEAYGVKNRKVTLDENGTGIVFASDCSEESWHTTKYLVNYLSISSNKTGEVNYTIDIYSEDGSICYSSHTGKMTFTKPVDVTLYPSNNLLFSGKVNNPILLKSKFTNTNILEGLKGIISFTIGKEYDIDIDLEKGNTRQPVPANSYGVAVLRDIEIKQDMEYTFWLTAHEQIPTHQLFTFELLDQNGQLIPGSQTYFRLDITNSATANEERPSTQPVVKATANGILVTTCSPEDNIRIFNLSGQVVKALAGQIGTQYIPLKTGIYILQIGKHTYKIAR